MVHLPQRGAGNIVWGLKAGELLLAGSRMGREREKQGQAEGKAKKQGHQSKGSEIFWGKVNFSWASGLPGRGSQSSNA
jgi:hypothetical protein